MVNPFPRFGAPLVGLAVLVSALPARPDTRPANGAAACAFLLRALDERGRPLAGATLAALDGTPLGTSGRDGGICLANAPQPPLLLSAARHLDVLLDADRLTADGLDVRLEPSWGDELTVTATRSERRRQEVPISVQVISRRELEQVAARTLADAVEWAPGVRVENNCQNCNFSQIRMLGLDGPYCQVLIDGQEALSSLARVYGIEQLPARAIAGIEVVKGGGSAIYGAGAVGGVVNLIPHQASATGGAFDLSATSVDGATGSSAAGLFDWLASDATTGLSVLAQLDHVPGVDLTGDGFTEISRRRLTAGEARLDRELHAGSGRLSLALSSAEEDRRGGDALDRPPHQALIAEWIATRLGGGTVRLVEQLRPSLGLTAVGSWSRTDRESYYGTGRDPNAYGDTSSEVGLVDLQLDHQREPTTLSIGLQADRRTLTDRQPAYRSRVEEESDSIGLFAQEDRKLGHGVTLLYGLRVDRHSLVDRTIVSPRAAAMVTPVENLTFRLSYAAGFRPPEVFDEDLHVTLVGGGERQLTRNVSGLGEERSASTLASVEWLPSVGHGSAVIEATVFSTRLSDLFLRRLADDPATSVVEYERINHGSARVEGVELILGYQRPGRLRLELGWVEQRARLGSPDPDFGSRDMLRTPRRYGTAQLALTAGTLGDLFVGARYTGSMLAPHYAGYVASDQLERTPSFVELDLSWSRRLPLAVALRPQLVLGVKNVGDAYQDDLDQGPDRDPAYVYGPRTPRTLYAALRFER